MSTPFATIYKHKGVIFQVSWGQEKIRRRSSVVCLFCILYYPPFCNFHHSSLLYLGVVRWLHICIRKLIFNPLIYLFVSELHVAFSKALFFRFVSELLDLVLMRLCLKWLFSDSYSYIWSLLFFLPSISVRVEFSGLQGTREVYWELGVG